MPVYGFGTWRLGRQSHLDPDQAYQAEAENLRAAVQDGIYHIDTAERYSDGKVEQIVGQAIKGLDRSKIFLVSKAKPENHSYDGIIKACRDSLQRLGTGYLDMYLLHAFSPEHDLKQAIRAMDDLVDQGLVKNIGISNFNVEHTEQAQQYTRHFIACNQVHYNLIFREPEASGLLQYCQENDIFLSAWRPVEKGVLAVDDNPVMHGMVEKYSKTPAQIAINWLMCQPNVVTLAKTSDRAHLEENLGALGWNLSAEDIEILRKTFPNQKNMSDAVPLG